MFSTTATGVETFKLIMGYIFQIDFCLIINNISKFYFNETTSGDFIIS